MKNILIVVAHPDDEVLSMGGTIAKLTAEGKTVHVLIVTDGSTAQYRDNSELNKIIGLKKAETELAAQKLGIASVRYGELPDMKLDVTPHIEINKVIEDAINLLQPDTVFTHFYGDVNLDHKRVYQSVEVAVRPTANQCVKSLYCFSTPSATEWSANKPETSFMPNVFVDVSKYVESKYQAMEAYATETREYPHPRSIRYLRETDRAEGIKVGLTAVESFMLMRKVL